MKRKRLYIFNPEHDLALANGETNYMAPASARQMATDLAILPLWYADSEGAVLASSSFNAAFVKSMEELLGVCMQLITPPELTSGEAYEVIPWGWDPALRKRLLSLGMDDSQLPSREYLEEVRRLSHRLQAVGLLPKLQMGEYFCGESFYLRTQEDCKSFVEGRKECLLKAPLSGSGKGLNWCKGVFTSFISGWCERVTVSQGGVIGEPIYNKVEDFAMEFYANGSGVVTFAGYSLFRTGGSGMYAGNELLSDEKILHKLSKYVPIEKLLGVQKRLEEELSVLIGHFYCGYLGVDMMICHFPDEAPVYRIHPCVEINLRMNMGVVARLLANRYLGPDTEGIFQIAFYTEAGLALQEHQRLTAAFPLEIKAGRVCAGYLSLVPVVTGSRYRAWIEVAGSSIDNGMGNSSIL